METIRRQLTWRETQSIEQAQGALIETQEKLDEAQTAHNISITDLIRSQKNLQTREEAVSAFQAVAPDTMPGRGARFYHIDPWIVPGLNAVEYPRELDPEGLAQVGIVTNPDYGYIVRFTAIEPGPALLVQLPRADAPTIHRNMRREHDRNQLRPEADAPLYLPGAILEYHGVGPMPSVESGAEFVVVSAMFQTESTMLRIIKTHDTLRLPSDSIHTETATYYTVLPGSITYGLPDAAFDILRNNILPQHITLVPIQGRVISTRKRCAATTRLGPDGKANERSYEIHIGIEEMAMPPPLEVKLASKKQ